MKTIIGLFAAAMLVLTSYTPATAEEFNPQPDPPGKVRSQSNAKKKDYKAVHDVEDKPGVRKKTKKTKTKKTKTKKTKSLGSPDTLNRHFSQPRAL